MKGRNSVLGVTALTLTVLMISTAYAGCVCKVGLSPGYWKHNVKVYNGGPGAYSAQDDESPHETDASMEGYAAWILAHYGSDPGIPSYVDTPEEFLAWANNVFQNNAYKSLWLTLANAFNWAAGRSSYNE